METTEIAPEKTAAEITHLLVQSGARQISLDYDAQGKLSGLRWVFPVGELPVSFTLPARVEPVYQVLLKRRKGYLDHVTRERLRLQAERVAWRQLLRWVQAQLALMDTGMVQAQEVFLPYLVQPGSNQTLFEYFAGQGFKQLPAGHD